MFTPLWLAHISCVFVFLVATFVLALIYRSRAAASHRRTIDLAVGIVGILSSALVNAWWLSPGRFDVRQSLPLQMCDIVGMLAPIAILTRAHTPRVLLHLWGFGLCSQWLITPVVKTGPETIDYWISFALHASILGSAAFDFWARGFRASWKDVGRAITIGAAYVLAMLIVNAALGSNYGYVGNTRPDLPTIVDHLGIWPLRVVWIALIGIFALVLIKLIDLAIDALLGRFGLTSLRSPPITARERLG